MADHVKAKKAAALSAARKKLKEYQQNQAGKKPAKNIKENVEPGSLANNAILNESETPVDSMASSTHSSVNLIQDLQTPTQENNVVVQENVFPHQTNVDNTQNYVFPQLTNVDNQHNEFSLQTSSSSGQNLEYLQQPYVNNNQNFEFSQPSAIDNGQNNMFLQQTDVGNGKNYFNTALFQGGENNHILSNYFDNLPKNTNDFTYNQPSHTFDLQHTSYSQNFDNIQNNENFTEKPENVVNEEPVEAINKIYVDPECEDSEHLNEKQCQFTQNAINSHIQKQMHYENTVSADPDEDSYHISAETEANSLEKNIAVPQNLEMPSAFVDSAKVIETNQKLYSESLSTQDSTKKLSNTESLRQLSSQLTNLIESAATVQSTNENSELEHRNQELAALLDIEKQKNEQLNLQVREYINRITQLEAESQQIRNEQDAKISREIGPLQEQLQYHVQTVGILVGEKTELTMSLNQSQAAAKQKTSECEELQGRLRASRHRVSELEKEVNALKSVKDNVDKTEQEYAREIERLKLEYGMLKDQFDETSEEASELREKLNVKMTEAQNLQQEIQEKNSQLSLAQIRIQQLTVGENLQTESQLETLNQQKISLEQQVLELTQTVKLVSSERDQASQQYQQYVQQLNTQLQNIAAQLQDKSRENENLSKREQNLVKHISELEKHLQQLQTERQNLVPVKTVDNSSNIKELEEKISSLETQKLEAEENFKESNEKLEYLEKNLQEKNLEIGELEFKIEQMTTDRPDTGKLLAAMESDKIAASRATEQNQKLKDQLAELQEGFVKMSNSKLELTEKLESEEHHCRELTDQLSHKATDLENLMRTLSAKDAELTELQAVKSELNKQILQQNQLLDRLRHYEAQGNVMDLLQQELKESNKSLEKVMTENAELNNIIADLHNKENISQNVDTVETKEISVNVQSNVGTVDTQENSINESIRRKIELLQSTNAELEKRIKDISNNDHEIKSDKYLDKEKAMVQLEERFTKIMSEIAELTEEKQRLEHLVLQLQNETETIGEYVTLYQCQRAMLKQKSLEKDEQLERLERDREELKFKLEELNNLIRKLVLEKGDIPEELLNSTLIKNYNNYCQVHSKENESKETTKINGSNENNNLGTAGQIIALLSEIKTSNLVQPGAEINFHPCPCCSGKLITV